MLQSKGINKIRELKNGFTHSWLEPEFNLSFLKCFSFFKEEATMQGLNEKISNKVLRSDISLSEKSITFTAAKNGV